ncbi:DUF4349 domain-containing protein [Halalkalibacillus sediminis]|uniref:DUF4349 domain-containing protein n=1 Tax=Halalkalibacillus sediminis TaxID=2018042 RepID=A0A2I0QV96_9BACI|nr:DUF4349 domain-containing protein [Halalkalibacillus sediminis]PKR78219.1 DUF4349 domain-containing protein [Halalkalibacillus sediminis]
MLRKIFFVSMIIVSVFLFSACSNSSSESSDNSMEGAEDSGDEAGFVENEESSSDGEQEGTTEDSKAEADTKTETEGTSSRSKKQMIIYEGQIAIEVKDYNEAYDKITDEINRVDGYIVESSEYSSGENDELRNGELTIRVPQENFRPFMSSLESASAKVLEKRTHGDDVTEEYVDLESRLRSKEAVEERLLTFLNEAEKTEDLLKISDDLSSVQEEIEQIKGRMTYLEDNVAFSTVTLSIRERSVNIAEIQTQDSLNTWERAQSFFMKTVNGIITMFSGLFVFFVGMSPVLVPLLIIGGGVWMIIRKRKKRNSNES